jgi:hypothetical protein
VNNSSTNNTNQPGSEHPDWDCELMQVGGHDVVHFWGPQVQAPETSLDSAQWFSFIVRTPSPAVQTTYNGTNGTEGYIVDQTYASGAIEHWIPDAAYVGDPPPGSNTIVAGGLARTVFAAPTLVTSEYDETEHEAFDAAALELGLDHEDYQWVSVHAIAYILRLAGINDPTPTEPPPGSGAESVTTEWSQLDYPVLEAMATQFDVTPAEAQKICSLAVAYILSIT